MQQNILKISLCLALSFCVLLISACSNDDKLIDTSVERKAEPTVAMTAPGWGELNFAKPVPGSYELPPIKPAGDGAVVLGDASKTTLHELFDPKKMTILSFVYTSCDDLNGCPLATFVMQAIKQRLQKRPDLASQVKLLTISFDPGNDTPEVMQSYGEDFQSEQLEWYFGAFDKQRPPFSMDATLNDYLQSVLREETETGSRVVAHLLKAYLIDKEGMIRNIYGIDLLHPDVLIADVETLLLERKVAQAH